MSESLRLPRLVAVLGALVLVLTACGAGGSEPAAVGDPARGHDRFVALNCGSCHRVDGMAQAQGRAGPALDDLATKRMIAGSLPMTPEFLAAWIQDPPAYAPDTGMPDLGVSAEDARDIAAWLLDR